MIDTCPICDPTASPFADTCEPHTDAPLMHKADPAAPWRCASDCPVTLAGLGGICRPALD